MKIKSRKEAVEIIKVQLGGGGRISNEDSGEWVTAFTHRAKPHCNSYGVQELRELMDLIYGGEPASHEEKI